ncbi:MAG: DNA cytosine methyltransferase [Actinobacteria bacterium]|jgi:DNA (cytosine-5)-methyltransferase 1|nr:DNA cytosine methyltransferase [Actinomycetota bacterium]
MNKIKVLNLYACLGGNRYKWDEVADIEVTAVELDPEAARLYQERFPNDKVVVADAHQYLLDHYKEFDFIWSSPPCPSHSKARFARKSTTTAIYPDFKLYEEVVFLDNYFDGKYCVENVVPFYEPLIAGKKRGRHLYWTNFNLPNDLQERKVSIMEGNDEVKRWCEFHDYDFYQYNGSQRIDKMARNLVDYEAGKTIFSVAMGVVIKSKDNQQSLF